MVSAVLLFLPECGRGAEMAVGLLRSDGLQPHHPSPSRRWAVARGQLCKHLGAPLQGWRHLLLGSLLVQRASGGEWFRDRAARVY